MRRGKIGRPLNPRYFGPPTDGGDEIRVQFHNNTSSVAGWIVKQTGSKRFVCSDGTVEAECYLVDKADGALAAGEMTITVLDDTATARQVTKISGRKVTADNNAMYPWVFTESNTDGNVQVEEAGGDVINVVDATEGVEYQIVVPGDTDFTLIGAADSNIGTIFTAATLANAAGTTGTVRLAPTDV